MRLLAPLPTGSGPSIKIDIKQPIARIKALKIGQKKCLIRPEKQLEGREFVFKKPLDMA